MPQSDDQSMMPQRNSGTPGAGRPGVPDLEPDDALAEAPRRAASAQFDVDAQVGAAAAMRQAMDPANQSLADALRLSYRVLQGVIVVLVILFAFSGMQTVQVGQSGVQLWFGKVISREGKTALEPGIRWSWLPYPAGEFVLIDAYNRDVDLGSRFWPLLRPGQSQQDAIAAANPNLSLNPGRDGYLLLEGGDIGHLKLTAKYQIDDPKRLLENLSSERVRRVVELAVSAAALEVCGSLQVQDLVDLSAEIKARVLAQAQARLDALGCGLTLTDVTVPDAKPAFAIASVQGDLQNAREDAAKAMGDAAGQAQKTLINVAGPNYAKLTEQIEAYEQAMDRGDDAAAAERLAVLGQLIEGPDAAGEIIRTIERARSYQTEIEGTLGAQARLFASLLDAYRTNPQLVVRTRWMEAYSDVLSQRDTEIYMMPLGIGLATLNIQGDEEIARLRRDLRLGDQGREAAREIQGFGEYIPRSDEVSTGRAVRRLRANEGQVLTPAQQRAK